MNSGELISSLKERVGKLEPGDAPKIIEFLKDFGEKSLMTVALYSESDLKCIIEMTLKKLAATPPPLSQERGEGSTFRYADPNWIYITIPAGKESTIVDDAKTYFSRFGTVQDVWIPYENTYGLVSFIHPDSMKAALAEGNFHIICDSPVFVEPYGYEYEAGKINTLVTGKMDSGELMSLLKERVRRLEPEDAPKIIEILEDFGEKSCMTLALYSESEFKCLMELILMELAATPPSTPPSLSRDRGEDSIFKYSDPNSHWIYISIPAGKESTIVDDAKTYFSQFGTVQYVWILNNENTHCMVSFIHPESRKAALARGNVHFICDSPVFVEPYEYEAGKMLYLLDSYQTAGDDDKKEI